MEYRRVLVVGDDIVVGHLFLALCAGLEIPHVGLVFGRSAAERREGCEMAASSQIARPAQAFDLVGGLDRPVEVQPGEQLRIIHRRRIRRKRVPGAHEGHAAEFGPFAAGRGGIRHRNQLDGLRPGFARQARGLVPVIVRLMKEHLGAGSRDVDQHALGIVEDRNPRLEMRIHLVGVRLVIQELDRRDTRMDDQGVKTGRRQRIVRPPHDGLQMVPIECIQTRIAHTALLELNSLQRLRRR